MIPGNNTHGVPQGKPTARYFRRTLARVACRCKSRAMAVRDRQEIASLQSRSLSYACGNKGRALAMLVNAARGLLAASPDLAPDKRKWATKVLGNLPAANEESDGPPR
jgi:hypothetical protein